MTMLVARVRRVLTFHGEPFTWNGSARRGIFTPLATGELNKYLPRFVVDAMNRPVWLIAVPASTPIPAGASLVWRGGPYLVRLSVEARSGGQLLAHLLIAEPV